MIDFYYTSIRVQGVATEYYVQRPEDYTAMGSHMLRTIALLSERTGEFTKKIKWDNYNTKCIGKSAFYQFQNRYSWAASCKCLWAQIQAQYTSRRGANKNALFSKPQIIGFNATLDRVENWCMNYFPAKKVIATDHQIKMVQHTGATTPTGTFYDLFTETE